MCESFVTSSKEAVDKVNDFVAAYNHGGDTTSAEGPAVDALNHSADTVEGDTNGPLSQELREALKHSPDNLPLRLHLAETLMGFARFEEAEKEYRLAAAASGDASCKLGLANAFYQQGKN